MAKIIQNMRHGQPWESAEKLSASICHYEWYRLTTVLPLLINGVKDGVTSAIVVYGSWGTRPEPQEGLPEQFEGYPVLWQHLPDQWIKSTP